MLYGALAAIATTLAWMIVQRALLEEYFGPIIKDVTGSAEKGEKRQAFKDSAGTPTPLRDTLLLLYYAAGGGGGGDGVGDARPVLVAAG